MLKNHRRGGFAIVELLVLLVLTAIVLAITIPTMARGRVISQIDVSLNNLLTLGVGQAIYAMDWNGRQCTIVDDELSTYGTDEQDAYFNYLIQNGVDHPPLYLGWNDGGLWAYWMDHGGNWGLCQPMVWPDGPSHLEQFGAFRVPNCKQFHDYVAGRYYEPTLFAPADWIPYGVVEPLFDDPNEFSIQSGASDTYWSCYCFSPAAMFHPDVMRSESFGGWQSPWDIPHGFESPGFWQARYPDLKTHILEHHWVQNSLPDPCNPAFDGGTYDDCEPYYFNHAIASEPATLFYDLSTRLLPNTEVLAADAISIHQTGYGLWSRDTPLGEDGYFGDVGYDVFSLAHHILTTDGILGRDTLPLGAIEHDIPASRSARPPRGDTRRHVISRDIAAEPR